jgi:ribosome biogenesis GTPase
MNGTVIFAANNLIQVLSEDGLIRLCSIKGKRIVALEGTYNGLAVGDIVDIAPTDAGRGTINALNARKNVFGRYNEKGKADQAIAANIDLVVCVSSADLPPFRPRFIDRVAVMAESASIPLLIVLNKSDLGIDDDTRIRLEGYASFGYGTINTSLRSGEGIEELAAFLKGKLSVLVGQSGVGKSSLINTMFPEAKLRTGDVSLKYNRGKHTTTMARMIYKDSPPLRVIDTPGMRRLAVRNISPDNLSAFFPEMADLVSNCLYGASCTHMEEKGCAIVAAVESGIIHPDRYESYARIREELCGSTEWMRTGNRDPGRDARARDSAGKRRSLSKRLNDEHEEDGLSE